MVTLLLQFPPLRNGQSSLRVAVKAYTMICVKYGRKVETTHKKVHDTILEDQCTK